MVDVVVAGLGGMGSAAAAQCAMRGERVLGVEQFARGHDRGASSGESRVIRRAYFEDAAYVPLLDRSYELWRELESRSGERILHTTGLLTAGFRGSEIVAGAEEAVRLHALDAQTWDATQIRSHFPALCVRDDEYGVFEPEGGFVVPETAIAAQLRIAEVHGADLRFETQVTGWETYRDGLLIRLSSGAVVTASRLILTLGAWFKSTLEAIGVPMRVQRNVATWFQPRGACDANIMPTFLIHRRELPAPFYGFPDFGCGTKAAFHGFGADTEAESLDRSIDLARDVEPIARAFEAWAPGAAAIYDRAKACMYALTPDHHFVIDFHPNDARVVLCGGFSGHGFKFAPVAGEIAAGLALDGGTPHDIGFLSLRRFARASREGN